MTTVPAQHAEPHSIAAGDLTTIALGRVDVRPPDAARARGAGPRSVLAARDRQSRRPSADILPVVAELHAVPFEQCAPRVCTVLKLDERRDREQTVEDEVASVQRLLG